TRQRQGGEEPDQHERLILQDDIERATVSLDDSLERPLGPSIETPVRLLRRRFQQLRRHHRRQRQRHRRRNQNRHRQGHRELAEQSADDVAHEEERDQYRDQRYRQRDDREADLLGPLQRRLQW